MCSGAWSFGQGSPNAASIPAVADFNGDGKTDIVYYTSTAAIAIRLSRGTSFTNPISIGSVASYTPIWTILDWDSDGYDDLLLPHVSSGMWHLFRSTGETLSAGVSTGLSFSGISGPITTDLNGDGLRDVRYTVGGALRYRPHAGAYPDLLQTATDGFGVSASFSYSPITQNNYSKYADATFPEQDYQGPLYVVGSVTASTGVASPSTFTQSFWYWGARVHLQGRGLEGFYAKRVIDNRNNLYAYDYFHRAFPYSGTVFQSDVYQPNGSTLISRTQNNWTAHPYNPGSYELRYLPFVNSSTTLQYEVGGTYNGTHIRTVTTSATVDTYGTPTDTTTTTTEVATGFNPGATHTQRVWHPAVTNDALSNWCLSKPTQTLLINSHALNGGTQLTRSVNHAWDYVNCRMTQEVIEPGSTLWKVTTDYGYDSFGNVNSQTVTPVDQAARVTSTYWGTTGQFPLTITNPLSQATTLAWIADRGLLDTLTDPNGLVVNYDYDTFGRKTRELKPDGTATRWSLGDCPPPFYCGESVLRYYVQEDRRNTSDGIVHDRYIYRDMFDREKYDEPRTLNGSLAVTHTVYDALGRVSTRSVPYLAGSSDPYSVVTLSYDLLNRVIQAQRQVSESDTSVMSTQWTFNGLSVTETNALSQQTTKKLNAIGQVIQVIDAAGSDTDYEYDAFGNLLKTRDVLGNEVTLGYNIRGFKTSSSDPDMGNWTYDYFPVGELKSQTNAKSQTVTFTYDKLSRPLTRLEPEGATTWTWGTSAAARNIGQLQSVSSPGGFSESYGYDLFGRPTQTNVVADATTYTIDQTYNSATGLLEVIAYPTSPGARFKVRYNYQNGFVQSAQLFVNDTPGQIYWQVNATNARGQIIDELRGNGLQTISGYDQIAGWLDDRISGPTGTATRQNQTYSWNRLGNLTQRQELNQGVTETFVYDALNRLDYSQLNGVTNLDLAYNAIGNITSKTGVGGYTYHATKKHAVATAGSNSYGYDANGNMTSRNGATITWASYDLPTAINQTGGNSSQFSYGADRARHKQVSVEGAATETRIYVKGLFEKVTRGSTIEYKHFIMGTVGAVALYTRRSTGVNDLLYLSYDHLGSTDILTSGGTSVYLRLSYDAFGKRRNGFTWTGTPSSAEYTQIGDSTHRGFTFHEHLDNLTLIHMNGRVYDPTIARFISADPYVPDPYDGQSFNRYSYVNNNPLSFTDPSGFSLEDDFRQVCTGWVCRSFTGHTGSVANLLGEIWPLVNISGPASRSPAGGGGGATPRSPPQPDPESVPEPPPPNPPEPGNPTVNPVNDGWLIPSTEDGRLIGEAFPQADGGYIVAPLGVDVRGNIGVAESHRDDAFIAKNRWFKPMVQNKGPWDYKQRSPGFEDFGNWHYGVVGAAAGFDKQYLLQAAGFAQVRAGTSPPDSGDPGIPGLTSGTPPYGDDPRDQHFISMGYDWYQNQNRAGDGQ